VAVRVVEPGEETRGVTEDVTSVGSMVTNADDGYVSVVATVTGSVLGPVVDVGILLVADDHTLVDMGGEELDAPEDSVPKRVNEEGMGEVAVTSVR
jgi:hypothetical protein